MRCAPLFLLAAACAAESATGDAGTPGATLSLRFRASGAPDSVVLERASASFSETRVVGDAGDHVGMGASVDLLGGDTVVVLTDVTPGLYSRVHLQLGPDEAETIDVDGRFRTLALRLRAREDHDIDLRSPEAQRLDPGGEAEIVVDVDRGRWFRGIDLDEAEVEEGRIDLDTEDGPNRDLAEEAVHGILQSFAVAGSGTPDGGLPDEHEVEDGGEDDGGAEDGGGEDDGG